MKTLTTLAACLLLMLPAESASRGKPVKATLTFYCTRCDRTQKTASGRSMKTRGIAADWRYYPKGTVVFVPGFGRYVVDDRGGAIKGRGRFDIRLTSRGQCARFGVRRLTVRVVRPATAKGRGGR